MKKLNLFFAILLVTVITGLMCSCGSKSGKKLEQKIEQNEQKEAVAQKALADSITYSQKNFTATPDSFFLSELKEEKTEGIYEGVGESCEAGSPDVVYTTTTEKLSFFVHIFIDGKSYKGEISDLSSYVTKGPKGGCFDDDPLRKKVKELRGHYETLNTIDENRLQINVVDGWLKGLKIIGKTNKRLKEEDISFYVFPLDNFF